LTGSDASARCSIVIIADGFREVEAIGVLSALRRAGLYAKSVGLTSGLIKGARGILVKPDLTLGELPGVLAATSIGLVFLPGDDQSLSHLAQDPRVHRLIREVVASEGMIATNPSGVRILRSAMRPPLRPGLDVESADVRPALLQYGLDQPIEAFAEGLIRRLV
jgi:putative intracellular protease/amidase